MAGIYIHIPFCRQACHYCNFHFATSLHYKDDMVKSIVKEALDEQGWLEGEQLDTIYFGGGTPSLLDGGSLETLIETIVKNYKVSTGAEITLEANPDDINPGRLQDWKNIGINRLSIGVQSFFDEELKWMNRAHNSYQALKGLEQALKEFNNITIDLIYGSPLLTDKMWKENVDRAVSMDIPHLSCYALTVEERTPLHKMIRLEKSKNVDEEKQARQFLILMQRLKEKGYEHYEVSNFAKQGYRSRHNSAYWRSEKYLGLGPSAHSYNGIERRWNIANNQAYIQKIVNGDKERENEILTSDQKLNEYIMISLRTIEGLNIARIKNDWGEEEFARISEKLLKYIPNKLILQNEHYLLTEEGMLIADGIAADLFK